MNLFDTVALFCLLPQLFKKMVCLRLFFLVSELPCINVCHSVETTI